MINKREINACVLCYSTSQFILATFQVLKNHKWLVAAILDPKG